MTNQFTLNRRDMLKALGLLGTSALVAACGPTGAPLPTATSAAAETASGAAAASGLKYDGITLRMLTQAGADYEAPFRAWAEEFTAETGAAVEFEFAPWETLMPKVQADLASGSPQFDLFCNDIEFQYTIWPNLEPINDFITSRTLSPAAAMTWKASLSRSTNMARALPATPACALVCRSSRVCRSSSIAKT